MKPYGQMSKIMKFSCCDCKKGCGSAGTKDTLAKAKVWRKRARREAKKQSQQD